MRKVGEFYRILEKKMRRRAKRRSRRGSWAVACGRSFPRGSHLLGGLLCLADVAVDEGHVLGHARVDAGAVLGATALGANDAHLHEAPGSTTHQRTTVVPLWKQVLGELKDQTDD